jgi:hypothetical protein
MTTGGGGPEHTRRRARKGVRNNTLTVSCGSQRCRYRPEEDSASKISVTSFCCVFVHYVQVPRGVVLRRSGSILHAGQIKVHFMPGSLPWRVCLHLWIRYILLAAVYLTLLPGAFALRARLRVGTLSIIVGAENSTLEGFYVFLPSCV